MNGIGRFSLTDFDRALRFGVANGHSLYPAMPFPSYANTTPEDVAALFASGRGRDAEHQERHRVSAVDAPAAHILASAVRAKANALASGVTYLAQN